MEGTTHVGRIRFVADMCLLWGNFGLRWDIVETEATPADKIRYNCSEGELVPEGVARVCGAMKSL